MTVVRKNVLTSFVWILVSLIEYHIISTISFSQKNLQILSLLLLVNVLFQIVLGKLLRLPFLTFFTLFVVFLYLFHFGQVITAAFFEDGNYEIVNYLTYYMTNRNVAWTTLNISLFAINLIFAGGLVKSDYQSSYKSKVINVNPYRVCYYMGWFLFVIGLPFRLYIDIRQLIVASSGGYAAVNAMSSATGVIGALGGFWYVSLPLIYLTLNSSRKKKAFLGATLLFILITMLTGNRGHQTVNIIAFLLVVFYDSRKKVRLREIIKWVIIVAFFLLLLNSIFSMRKYGISYYFQHFQSFFKSSLSDNLLVKTIHNFGATVFTPYLVISGYGTTYTPFFGETYIKSFASVIPDVFHVLRNINNEAVFSRVLETNHAIGGSFIGELYYNFGPAYFFFAYLFGIFYGAISKQLYQAFSHRDYGLVCVYLPFCIYSLWWVRDTVGGITRPVIWLLLLYWVITRLMNKSSRRKPQEKLNYAIK